MATTRDLGTYEMLWDCPSCDTKKLLGKTHRYCPHCGSPQAADKRYFPPEGEEVAVQDHVYTGVDWQCPGCDTPNGSAADFCGSCGGPREGEGRKVALKAEAAPPPPPAKGGRGGTGAMIFGLVAAVLVLLCGGGLLLNMFWREDVVLIVDARAWDRTVAVERYGPSSREGWCDEVPRSATVTSRFEAQRSTREVPDGETCATRKKDQGDGTFKEVEECTPKTRQEPVMADKCRYSVLDWSVDRTLHAAGTSTTPAWPDTSTLRGGTAVGSERAAARAETYKVTLRNAASGEQQTCTVDEARWSELVDGSRWTGSAGMLTGGIDCGDLAKAQ